MVLAHMHLMAIQKAVYSALGKAEILQLLYQADSQYSAQYKRSWDIVELEGPDAFLSELRAGILRNFLATPSF